MLCPQCKKKEANVHFSGIINGKEIKLTVCGDCAKTSIPGFESAMSGFMNFPVQFPSASPVFSEFLDILSHWPGKGSNASLSRKSCPRCRWTLALLQKTGKMGCPECYLQFETQARELLKRIHGRMIHQGKTLPGHVTKRVEKSKVKEAKDSVSDLKLKLERAVKDENYELAAKFRDAIRAMEKEA